MRFASAVLGVVAVAALALLSNRLDNSPEPEPIQVTVDAGEVRGQQLGRDASGRVTYAGHLFTGTQIDVSAGIRTEQAAYSMGLRSGLTERWYHDGTRSFRGTYHNGRRHGRIETWWPDGKRRSVSNYVDGVAHGIQREWYRSGALFKEVRLVNGKEDGLQRAWRENGALYTNYEARNGRIYGLKRANLCYELDDEQIVTN